MEPAAAANAQPVGQRARFAEITEVRIHDIRLHLAAVGHDGQGQDAGRRKVEVAPHGALPERLPDELHLEMTRRLQRPDEKSEGFARRAPGAAAQQT
jgi:hypothetical protein